MFIILLNMLLYRKKTVEFQTVEDLAGLKVGAQLGSIQEEKAKELSEANWIYL